MHKIHVTDSENPEYRIGLGGSKTSGYPQALLKRKPGLTFATFHFVDREVERSEI